jgi:hypothetical protein
MQCKLLALIIYDGSSRNCAVACETSARRPGDWLAVFGDASPVAPQTGTGAKKKDASPQQYVEGTSGGPARRRLLAAANPRLQQKCS